MEAREEKTQYDSHEDHGEHGERDDKEAEQAQLLERERLALLEHNQRIVKERRANAEQAYAQFAKDLAKLAHFTFEYPPDTLLDDDQKSDMYDPERDHFSTLYILSEFEKKGSIPGIPRAQLADEATVRQQIERRRRQRERSLVAHTEDMSQTERTMQLTAQFQAQPDIGTMKDLLLRDPDDLDLALESAHRYKKSVFRDLDESVRRDQMRCLLELKQWDAMTRYDRQQRGDARDLNVRHDRVHGAASESTEGDMWTEYLLETFVEPEEEKWNRVQQMVREQRSQEAVSIRGSNGLDTDSTQSDSNSAAIQSKL